MGAMVSPLTGPAGNVEFLLHARKGAPAAGAADGRAASSRPPFRRRSPDETPPTPAD